MKYLPYILKHLRRNWIRTPARDLGMAVCIFLFCIAAERARGRRLQHGERRREPR